MFNDELEILELRLAYMYPYVDFFVIAESAITHSNQHKELYYFKHKEKYSKYQDKILYCQVPPIPQKDSWEGEFFQRDYIKNQLLNCKEDDIVIVSDVDEIINMDHLLSNFTLDKPYLIQMDMFYYFINLKVSDDWTRTLITPYKFIKDFNIGDRMKYIYLNPQVLKNNDGNAISLGWHFSYLFGFNLELYVSKLKSFSHQEYNTPYHLNEERIKICLILGIDFLERKLIYKPVSITENITPDLKKALLETGFIPEYIYTPPKWYFFLKYNNLKYYLKFKLLLGLYRKIQMKKNSILQTLGQ